MGYSPTSNIISNINLGLITGFGYTHLDWACDGVINNVAWREDGDVTTVWAIPEPATVSLLGLGILALICSRKRPR